MDKSHFLFSIFAVTVFFADTKKDEANKKKISAMDVARVLQFLGERPNRNFVNLVIWEVDDDLDGFVNYDEFLTMYRRCIVSEQLARQHGLEPRLEPSQLFNLVQFLMYDKTFKGRVTVEETLQILFVRHGRDKLDEEIKAIFGDEEKNPDGSDKEITFGEYVEKIQSRALFNHKEALVKIRKGVVSMPEQAEED